MGLRSNSYKLNLHKADTFLGTFFERVILQQLNDHIESKAIYLAQQSGFRKSHSTTTILLKLKDDIKAAMNRGEVTLAVFADFSKAFDTISVPKRKSHQETASGSGSGMRWHGRRSLKNGRSTAAG